MNDWMLAALAALLVGYGLWGALLARRWGVDASRKTPAVELADGKDYRPTHAAALVFRHVLATAGAWLLAAIACGCAVEHTAALMGICFALGLLCGTVCFAAAFASIRHDGRGIAEVMDRQIGPESRRMFLVLALAVSLMTAALALLAGTAGLVYLDGWRAGAVSMLFGESTAAFFGAALGFGTLACADCAAKRLRSERSARRVGLGGTLLAASASACVVYVISRADAARMDDPFAMFAYAVASMFGETGPAVQTNEGYARVSMALCVAYALLCAGTLATAIRVSRMTIQALADGGRSRLSRTLRNGRAAWLLAVAAAVLLCLFDEQRLLPLLAPAGLLTAAAAMTACAAWFKHIGRGNVLFAVLATVLFLAAAAALAWMIAGGVAWMRTGGAFLVDGIVRCVGGALLLIPAARLLADGVAALRAGRY